MRKFILFFLLLLLCFPIVSLAHPGRTDANGGHYDRSTGEYHYHHGYPAHQHTDGICPYDYDESTNESSYTPSSKLAEHSDGSLNNTNNPSNINSFDTNKGDNPLEVFILFIVAALGICYTLWIVFSLLSLIPFLEVLKKPAKWFASGVAYIASSIVFVPLAILGIIFLIPSIPSKIYHLLFPKKKEEQEKAAKTQPKEPEPTLNINKLNIKDVKIDPIWSKSKKKHITPDWLIPNGFVIGKNNLPADTNAPRHWGKTFTVYLNPTEHIYHKGSCKYVNPESCRPEHIIMVFRDNAPCNICNPKIPDFKWYFDYLEEEKKINK